MTHLDDTEAPDLILHSTVFDTLVTLANFANEEFISLAGDSLMLAGKLAVEETDADIKVSSIVTHQVERKIYK